MKKFNLYGLPKNENRDYMEILLASEKPLSDIIKIKAIAKIDDYHNFRIVEFNFGTPDFSMIF